MKKIKLTAKEKKELKRVKEYFLEAVEPIEDSYLRAVVAARICSRIGALADRLGRELEVKSAAVTGKVLPGLTEDETRYFQWLLCRKLGMTTKQQWKDLTILNQKTLKAMFDR